MGKYKPKPIKYNLGGNIVKIRIEDETGAVIERWTVMMSDLWKWERAMRMKYGEIFKEKKDDWNRDLGWSLK